MVPLSPTATYEYFPKVTPFREFDVPDSLEVHVVRSEEVRIVPLSPTATKDAVESEEVVVVNPFVVSYWLLKAFPEESFTPVVTRIL